MFTEFSFRLGAVCMYKVGRDPSPSQPLSWDFAEYLKGYTNSSDGAASFEACSGCLSPCKKSACAVPATPQFWSLGKSASPEKLLPVGARTSQCALW